MALAQLSIHAHLLLLFLFLCLLAPHDLYAACPLGLIVINRISLCCSSSEGERLRQFQHSLKLENDGRVFLIFPTVLCHVIDAQSPLYDLSAKDLLEKR